MDAGVEQAGSGLRGWRSVIRNGNEVVWRSAEVLRNRDQSTPRCMSARDYASAVLGAIESGEIPPRLLAWVNQFARRNGQTLKNEIELIAAQIRTTL